MTSKTWLVIIHIKPLSKISNLSKSYQKMLTIGIFFDQTLKFDRFIDILSHQTCVKFLDRIYTSNPINKISNVWSGLPYVFASALLLSLVEQTLLLNLMLNCSCNRLQLH
jgi:hypothetical protein